MAGIPSFIFGAGTKYKTQEELDRAREQVKALLGDIGQSGLTGWGSALADLGKGISARVEKGRIGEGQEGLSAEQSKLWDMFGGGYGGADPDAIVATSGADTLPAGSAGADPVAQALARQPESSAPRGGGGGDGYLRYANQGATRNKPLAPKLEQALGFLSDLGVTAEVFSGGQDASGPHRTGSHRHDYGNAGDIRFYKDGRQLRAWANKANLPLFQEIVRRGKAAGITGFGAGPGYMGEGTMHVGFGTPSVWGAGGRSRNAPSWLSAAYSGERVDPVDPRIRGHGNEGNEPEPAPAPAPVPVRNVPVNDAGLRTPAGADFLSRMGNPAPMAQQQPPMVPPVPQRRMVNPASMSGGPMPSLQQPVPPPPPAPAPAPPAPAPAPPAPPPQVDPFTQMILGDKAGQFKPGNYIPPAPVGKQVFPAVPPAPGTQQAAGFGVPQQVMARGGGANRQVGGGGGGGGGQFPPAPAAPQQGGGDKIAKLQFILASPYASKEQKLMAASMIEREYVLEDERRKAASPEAQLDIQYKKAQIAALTEKDKDPALINAGDGRLYNPKTGEWITAPAAAGDGGPFSGDSVEAQALNGMVKSGRISVQQAYDLAAGKTITDPATGAMIFMSGAELVGALPGQPPQVIQPAPQSTPAPAGSPQPAPQAPAQTTVPPPAGTPGRPLTAGKPGKLATEAETRARALYAVASPEMKTVETMFPALSDVKEQVISKLPWGTSNWATSEDYQRGKNALMTIIQSYMYVTSGASAPDAEVERNAVSLMPQPGEKPGTIKDKLARIQNYVKAIKMAGGQGEEAAPAAGGGGNVDYNSIYGLPPVPK